MGRSKDFGLIFFGWFQAVGGCRPIETALKALMFIFDGCHFYTYIYRYRESGKYDFVDRNRGFVDENRGFVDKHLLRGCKIKGLLYLCNRELVKRYTRVAFHLEGGESCPFFVSVFCSFVIGFY